MNHLQKIFLTVAAAAALAACGDKKEASTTPIAANEQSAPAADVQELKLLGENDNGGVTLVEVDAPEGSEIASLIAQTQDNMKAKDPSAKMLKDGEFKIGGHVAKTFEAQMVSDGKDVQIVTAMTLIDGKMVSIQVLGPKNDAKNVAARAKAIFESVSLKAA